jgi:hypothetical protein
MGYTRRKNRSKRKLGKKGRSKKRRSYKKLKYLRGGVGTPVPGTPVPGTPVPGTPIAGNSPINMNFITPPNNQNNPNNVSPIGNNLENQFDDEAAAAALRINRNTVVNGDPTSVTNEYFDKI